eukprot:TRINITY_DN49037_c0_g1_i1.p1 TRINITY_DN49037_c0_g1~~TRINITY_DN49037_c0_g1_i1.p1  ORF type:complete len:332 (-),score=55.11 TRINITY_DN49037_c0_g1_i1:160-1155(-)
MMLADRSRVLSVSELLTWGKMKTEPNFDLGDSSDRELVSPRSSSPSEEHFNSDSASSYGDDFHTSRARFLERHELSKMWPNSDKLKAIFLDYDGTLREFEERPEQAVPTPEVQRLLAALNARPDLQVYIISGRDAGFLKDHLGMHSRITLIAEHERRIAGRFQVFRPESNAWSSAPQWKQLVRSHVIDTATAVEGCRWEEKSTSLVWHYRGILDKALGVSMAQDLVEKLERLKTSKALDVKITFGNKMVEVSSRTETKGTVMRRLCEGRAAVREPFEAVLVAGDGVSDESMFQAAQHSFLTVKVGRSDTHARFCVDTPEQLRSLLWQIASE